MPGDRAMTCTQLKEEFAKLDVIKRDADSDKGVNGANVAAVLLFWPAAAGNYLNARDAQQLAEQRRTHLMTFYNEKQCDNPANANLTFSVPAALLAPVGRGSLQGVSTSRDRTAASPGAAVFISTNNSCRAA